MTVVLIGTLDTKGQEYRYLRDCVLEAGAEAVVVDFGVLNAPAFEPDISASEVAKKGGGSLEQLRFSREGSDTRAEALSVMKQGLIQVLKKLRQEGKCDAILAAGGSGGSSVASEAMRSLPAGLPKVLVSTMASGNVRGYVGTKDLCLIYSITDVSGLNRVSRRILKNAAYGAVGMAKAGLTSEEAEDKPLVAITMFGITTPAVTRIRSNLENRGFETVVFHAVGSGGQAMEEMIRDGQIDGVVDFTISELTDEMLGGVFPAHASRLTAAGEKGIPQVVVPGALEVLNFGPRDTVPAEFDVPERQLIVHNPNVSAVKVTKQEIAELARRVAEKVNTAAGPTTLMIPTEGFDKYQQKPDGPCDHDALVNTVSEVLGQELSDQVAIKYLENNANDESFADAVVEEFMQLWKLKAEKR